MHCSLWIWSNINLFCLVQTTVLWFNYRKWMVYLHCFSLDQLHFLIYWCSFLASGLPAYVYCGFSESSGKRPWERQHVSNVILICLCGFGFFDIWCSSLTLSFQKHDLTRYSWIEKKMVTFSRWRVPLMLNFTSMPCRAWPWARYKALLSYMTCGTILAMCKYLVYFSMLQIFAHAQTHYMIKIFLISWTTWMLNLLCEREIWFLPWIFFVEFILKLL